MTDNVIIKYLESLLDTMRAYESSQTSIGKGLVEDIISMYERQKAEVERLKDDKNRLEKMMDNLCKELDAEKNKNF